MSAADRARYVALAFCRADILLEIEPTNTIVFISGATMACFGAPPEELVGRTILDLIAPRDRALVAEVLDLARNRGKVDDVLIHVAGSAGKEARAALAGYRVPDYSDNFYLALKIAPLPIGCAPPVELTADKETGLLDKRSFTAAAACAASALPRAGGQTQMTLVKLCGLGDVTARLAAAPRLKMMESIAAVLRAASVGGNVAGRVEDDTFGFLHARGADTSAVTRQIEEAVEAAAPAGTMLETSAVTLDTAGTEIGEEQIAKALAHTIRQFVSTGGFVKAKSLAEALPSMMADTFDKVAYVKHVSKNQAFDIVFMPICDFKEERVHHFEALTRFRDAVAGASPYHIISLAEEMDLIRDLDMAIIMKVIQRVRELTHIDARKRRYLPPVAVNVSGASIANYGFVHKLTQLLSTDAGIKDHLMLEITESARIERLAEVNKSIQTFRAKGFEVCIDDFGAGAASIDYLHMLDVDVVKFDGPVVKRALASAKGAEMLTAMARMCREMAVKTVAEMVEDKTIADKALECGVDFGQGYYFGKPAPNPFIFADKFAPGR